jgi:hypothetical protein
MPPIFVASRDNRCAARNSFVRFLANQSRGRRTAQARVRSRCTTAAPKCVTSATERVTAQRNESFCNRRVASGWSQQRKISFNAAAKTS